jgi:hypothetical protein
MSAIHSLQVLPDVLKKEIFGFVENPIPFLSTSKRFSKHASGALRGKNQLINTLLNKCQGDLKQFQKGFLKTEGWSRTITALDLHSKLDRNNLRCITQLFPQLQSLRLSVDFSENLLPELVQLKSLQELILVGPDNRRPIIQTEYFEEIAKIEKLRKLSIERGLVSLPGGAGFEHLVARCPLQELKLERVIDNGQIVQAIGKMKTLKRLNLFCLNIDGLSALTELEHFTFHTILLETKDLVTIGKMTSLKTLNILGSLKEGNLDGFQHLVQLSELREISLPRIPRNDNRVFEYLTQIKTIEKLDLSRCYNLDDFSYLARFPKLKEVVFNPYQQPSFKDIMQIKVLRNMYQDSLFYRICFMIYDLFMAIMNSCMTALPSCFRWLHTLEVRA